MQVEDKRNQIAAWFTSQKPKLPWKSLAIAVVLILAGLGLDFNVWFIIPGLILGGIKAYLYVQGKAKYETSASTNQMVEWLKEDLEFFKENSLDQVGLDEDETVSESIIVAGPIYWQIPGVELDEDEILRRETDSGYLYSIWSLVVIHICENSLSVYRCCYNWPKDQVADVSTSEYFYRNIASVQTSTASIKYRVLTRESKNRSEGEEVERSGPTFAISMSSGEVLQIMIDATDLKVQSPEELSKNAQNATQSIRRMLREKL